jgi:LacI family transcriptional regulator
MRDVGRIAGVSPMTVSRVLSEDARVAPATRTRVISAISTLGYRRDEVARSLRPGQATGLVGLIVPNLAIPFYSWLALAVEEAVHQRDLTLIVGNTGRDPTRERQLVQRLLSRRVDGILIEPTGREQAHLRDAIADTPLVFIAQPPVGVAADCVLHDDFHGARLGTIDLIKRGHTRIGFAGDTRHSYANAGRLRGFKSALREHGLPCSPRHLLRHVDDAQSSETAVAALLRGADPPTALFTVHNRMTVGAVRAMYKLGRRLEIAQFGDFDFGDMLGCPLSIVVSDHRALVKEAVRLLLERIDGIDVPPRRVRTQARLECREPLWLAPIGQPPSDTYLQGESMGGCAIGPPHGCRAQDIDKE